MKRNLMLLRLIFASCLLCLSGCAPGTVLTTRALSTPEPGRGMYDLILFGGQNPYDFRTVAILDRADDQYTIIPHGAEFNYQIIKGLPAEEAMTLGNQFISGIGEYRSTEVEEISGPGNSVIGYEMRPIYMPLTTGWLGDLLSSSYFLTEENQVTVYISVKGEHSDREEFKRGGLRGN